MKELLEAGVHFGHQTKRWNPKMKEYIFGERNGIYIIDLQKTVKLFREALQYVANLAAQGQHDSVRRNQATGPGVDRGRSRALRDALRQRALAGRAAHQLHDRPRSLERLRDLEAMATDGRYERADQEGSRAHREGEAQAAEEPRGITT